MTRPSTSNTLSPMNRAVPSIRVTFGVPVARYSRPPAEIGSIRPKMRSRMLAQSAPLNCVSIPSFAECLRRHRHVGGEHEHLGGDAAAIETRAAEHVAFDERDLPVVEELRDRVAGPAPDDDQVELFGAWTEESCRTMTDGAHRDRSQPGAPGHAHHLLHALRFANGSAVRHAGGDVGSTDGRRVHAVQRRARPLGHLRRGRRGVRVPTPTRPRVMLQKRSAFAHEGGTWSCAGGALDLGETPLEGALREASEEVGAIPAEARVVGEYLFVPATDWTYTTVVVEVDEPFGDSMNFETDAVDWFTVRRGGRSSRCTSGSRSRGRTCVRSLPDDDRHAATVNGTCHHDCPDSCGWTVTVEATGRRRQAARQRRPPVHAGELCPKVNRFLDRVYSPDRILHPAAPRRPEGCGRVRADHVGRRARRDRRRGCTASSPPTAPRRSCRSATPATRACCR